MNYERLKIDQLKPGNLYGVSWPSGSEMDPTPYEVCVFYSPKKIGVITVDYRDFLADNKANTVGLRFGVNGESEGDVRDPSKDHYSFYELNFSLWKKFLEWEIILRENQIKHEAAMLEQHKEFLQHYLKFKEKHEIQPSGRVENILKEYFKPLADDAIKAGETYIIVGSYIPNDGLIIEFGYVSGDTKENCNCISLITCGLKQFLVDGTLKEAQLTQINLPFKAEYVIAFDETLWNKFTDAIIAKKVEAANETKLAADQAKDLKNVFTPKKKANGVKLKNK